MKSLNCCRLTIVGNYYLQNVIFTSGVEAKAGRVASSPRLAGASARPGLEGCRDPRGIKGYGDPRGMDTRGIRETLLRGPGKIRTRSRPLADLTPDAKKRRPAGRPGHRLEQCLTPADWALGSGDRAPRSRSSGTRSPQRPRAPGCTERPRAVQERPPGRSNERPGDPGPQERIPPRRPAARVLNSPQDHQLPVFHRLLVGGAGFLLAG